MIVDWHTNLIVDLQYTVGERWFRNAYSATARFLIRGAVDALHAAAAAVAIAAVLSAITERSRRWLPARRTLSLLAVLMAVDLAGLAIASYGRALTFSALFSFGPDWIERNMQPIQRILLAVSLVDVFMPIAALIAIVVARRIFAVEAAQSRRPTAGRAVIAALMVLVPGSVLALADRVLLILPAGVEAVSQPSALSLLALIVYLALTAAVTAFFAVAVVVAAFGSPARDGP